MRIKKAIVWLATALLTLMVIVFIATFNKLNQEKITIAIAAPLSNVEEVTQKVGRSLVQGVQLYIDQANRNGGIQGKLLKLDIYDDQGKVNVAEKIAKDIVQSKAVAVIGHYSSSISKAAGKIYQDAGIPAISGSATADEVTEGSNWYFRTIFADSFQGRFIANYLKKVMGYSKISIIHGYDSYGLGLGGTVDATFRELGGEIITKWELPENQSQATDRMIIQELQELKKLGKVPQAIVLATGRDQVITLIPELKNSNLEIPLFGGDDIGDVIIAQNFAKLPEEQKIPGFFTNGLYATVPIIYDVADDLTQKFRTTFEQIYGNAPGWSAASYYDAASAIVEGIERTLLTYKELPKESFTGKNIKEDRELLKEALLRIDSPEKAVKTGTRSFYFDDLHTAVVPIAIGRFDKGSLVSAFTQLQKITNFETISDNLEAEIKKGNILQIGKQYLQKTDIVYAGLDINEVSYLDQRNSTYVVDFYLWFGYKGNLSPEKIEFSNYGISRLDSGEKLTLGEPIQQGEENGVKYKIYRVKADFHEEFDFHNYPFDEQRLAVRFRHADLTRDKLIYAIDLIGMRDSTTDKLSPEWKQKVFKEITSWTPQRITFFQDTLVNDSTLGYRKFTTKSDLEYSQFNAVINIKREVLSFSIKNLLPLWFFVGVAYLLLFLPFNQLSAEVLSGLLLAVVFFHLSLLDALPDGVGYVVTLDYAFYLVYALLGLELLIVTVGNQDRFQNSEVQLKKLILSGKIAFPVIILIGCCSLYFLYV